MSLEQALAENTAVMKQLITVMQSATHGSVKQDAPKKETAPAASTPAAGHTNDAAGNPIGTQYFDVPAHNTVYAVKPGEAGPNVAGAQPIADSQYLTKKAEYAGKVNAAVATAAPAPAPTAAPATGAPSATPQPATASVAQPQVDGPAFPAVVAALTALHKSGGNDALAPLLAKFGVAKVPELNGKADNAAVIAAAVEAKAAVEAEAKRVADAQAMGLV